jgi:predicted component of type VI protein secretion system
MPALIQIDSQRRHELGERSSIGRAGSNDIQLDDPMVSRNHAEVVRQADGSYQVRDLGSQRGTYVGAHKISEAPLCDGDELLIGPIRLRFESARAAASATGDADELRKLRAIVELSRAIGVERDRGADPLGRTGRGRDVDQRAQPDHGDPRAVHAHGDRR